MKRLFIILCGTVITLGAVILFAMSTTDDNVTRSTNGKVDQVTSSPPSTQGPAQNTKGQEATVDGNSISIVNYAFTPQTLTVKKGTTVSWTNDDNIAHNVVSSSGNELSSPLFGKNESFTHTFSSAGTFDYYCQPHPYMKGTIIVTQ